MNKSLLTIEQVAKTLNVSYARAARLAREGALPVVRLGRQYRVDPERLSDFVAAGGCPLPGGWRREAT